MTVRQAAEEFLEGIDRGTITDRSGKRYKPSTVRSYRRALNLLVLDALGDRRLTDLRRPEIQEKVDEWAVELSPSTVRNTIDPLRAIYRRALKREMVGEPGPKALRAGIDSLLAGLRARDGRTWKAVSGPDCLDDGAEPPTPEDA